MSFHFQKDLLNFKSQSIQGSYATSKAKKLHVKEFPECAVCGSTRDLEVHHVTPVHINPDLATNELNFITLCDSTNNGCHRWFGHFGNFTKLYNIYVREYALCNRLFLELMQPDRKFIISTKILEEYFSKSMNMTAPEFRIHYMNMATNIFRIPII